jgi:hypothetical protein
LKKASSEVWSLASPMDNPNQERIQIENWARRVLGRILYVADSALAPISNGLDFDELRVKGTRTILVEDVNRLEQSRALLQSAFNYLSTHFKKNGTTASQKEQFFERLGEVMNAAYYIGAYTTITDRIHEVVNPLNRLEQAKLARKGKARKFIGSDDAKKKELLREAVRHIMEISPSDGKYGASLARYRLIRERVGAAPKDTWPSVSTVWRVIKNVRDEAERKEPQP